MKDKKIISKKTVFQSRHFKINQIKVQRNGKVFTKDIFERFPVVFILPYTAKGDVYMELQYRDAFGKTILELVSGHMNSESEDPLEAAKRELREETGLTAKTWKKIATWELSVSMNAPIHVYCATGLQEGEVTLDDDEVIDVVKLPLTEVLEKIEKGELIAATHVATLLLFDKLKREGKL